MRFGNRVASNLGGEGLREAQGNRLVAAKDMVGVDPDGFLGDIGGHRRMAVAIPADPRPEPQERGHERLLQLACPRAARARHVRVDQPVQLRREAVERLVEDDHRGADLVDRRRGAAPQLRGPPQDGDLLAQLSTEVAVGGWREARVIGPLEQQRDPAQRDQDGPASRLRGVRGEDRMDAHASQRLAGPGPAQRRPDSGALGSARRRPRPPRGAPDAVPRLGEVDQLEVQAEGADDAFERVRIDGQDVERHALVRFAPAGGDRALPRRLDEIEDLRPGLLQDDLAEERAEQSNLAAKDVGRAGRPDAARLRSLGVPRTATAAGHAITMAAR